MDQVENKVETIKVTKKLGSEKSRPEFGPEKRCKEEDTLKDVKRGRTALSLDG